MNKAILLLCAVFFLSLPLVLLAAPDSAVREFDAPSTDCAAVKNIMSLYGERHPWVTLNSGVRYRDIYIGEGRPIRKGVAVHTQIKGYFPGGVEFENTFKRGEWATFTYGMKGAVIPGFEQGLGGMKERGKRLILIPAPLAYGSRGYREEDVEVPPDTDLVLVVSLMWIREPEFDKLTIFR